MTTSTKQLFDPTRLTVPPRAELIAASPWVAEIPGLAAQAEHWLQLTEIRQAEVLRRARTLARPGLDGAVAAGVGRVAGHLVLQAVGDLLLARVRADEPGLAPDDPAPSRNVERMEQLVRAGGPAWVKLGQFIATADGLLPSEWVDTFSWCRDEAPKLPRRLPRRIVRRAFGCRVSDLFAEFDDRPIGAASIAQVHRARLHDGREVVVKIRRPGLRQRFTRDIRAMAAAAWTAEKLSAVARAGNPTGFVELFAQLVLEELDFRFEAINMVELGAAAEHAGAGYVRFPRPIPGMVTERVLVMERLAGAAYNSVEVDDEVGRQLLRFAIQGVLEHTLVYGVFHGDLHAGNVLLDRHSGTLGLVDFGIVGRLGDDQRRALGRFLIAFTQMDVRAQLEAMVEFGAVPRGLDLDALTAEIEREVRPHELSDDADVSELAEAVTRLVRVIAAHGVQLPKELVLFFKNLLYLNGFAASVAPGAPLLGEVAPVFGYFHQKYGDAIDLSALLGD